jgi:hypothetical protein
MKHTFFALLSSLSLAAHAVEHHSEYRADLEATRERLRVLDIERNDYRLEEPALAPAQEEERLRLLGKLLEEDPVWSISQQLQADISALITQAVQTPEERALHDDLKDLLAIAMGVEGRARTRKQAEADATVLRQFIARRDVAGAGAWARSQ